jgi:hypothetical protein
MIQEDLQTPPTPIPLACQRDLERARIVAHQTHSAEDAPKLNDWSKHPIFPPNGSHSAFMLRSVSEEPGCSFEILSADRQLYLRRLLHIPHPLAIHVRCADVEPVAVKDEPDRDVVGLLGLASILTQSRGLLSRYPPQSRKFGRFHKLSLATFNMNQQLPLNVPKLLLGHPKIVPQFMYESLADLMTHFSLA